MILRKLKKWLGNLPIFIVRRSDLRYMNTIMTKDNYETIFKYYLGKYVEYKIEQSGGLVDVYVKNNCIWLNMRYEQMKKFIELRCMICVTMHYA